jgi:hypothetical protein
MEMPVKQLVSAVWGGYFLGHMNGAIRRLGQPLQPAQPAPRVDLT